MNVLLPVDLEDVWRVLAENPGAGVYAGGTDFLVRLRKGGPVPGVLVCLERVREIRDIRKTQEGLFIGAAVTHTECLQNPLVREGFPLLAQALEVLGSPLVRNMGTIGGNVVTASPAGDTLPPLYVLKAEVEISGHAGSRRMAIRDFILGPGKTALGPGEVLKGVRLKRPGSGLIQHFEKVGQRGSLAISVVSLAAILRLDPSGCILKARLAWGSVGPTVVTSEAAEKALEGCLLDEQTLRRAACLAKKAVSPIDDLRASAGYRREVAGNLLFRLPGCFRSRSGKGFPARSPREGDTSVSGVIPC